MIISIWKFNLILYVKKPKYIFWIMFYNLIDQYEIYINIYWVVYVIS
jgi:hypothetical protein